MPPSSPSSYAPDQFPAKVASSFADWCKLIQSIESALDVRDGLAILKTSADAAVAVEGSYGHQAFLARLLGNVESYRCLQRQGWHFTLGASCTSEMGLFFHMPG